ncbi:MAG: hypothetical protein M3Y58_05445 [Chloroflexota bacterium]|nr:hypothetical protein [Chloroflexota bacterium]
MHETVTRARPPTVHAAVAPPDTGNTPPSLVIRHQFADHADERAYAAHFRWSFIEFIGRYGRHATTYAQQYEAARLAAIAIVADPRFRMRYQHRDAAKNRAMVQALRYWRNYQDILPADEVARRRDAYRQTLPLPGRLRLRHAAGQLHPPIEESSPTLRAETSAIP